MTDLDELAFDYPAAPPNPAAVARRCPHPRAARRPLEDGGTACTRCGADISAAGSRRARNNRSRGNRHELHAARLYGGEKTGPLGGPEDIRGAEWRTQVKTHAGLPPRWLTDPFARMADQHDGRSARTLHRWLRPGQRPIDLFVVEGREWLDKFGPDE